MGQHLTFATLLAGLELDLAAQDVERRLEVDDPRDRGILSRDVARCRAAAATVSAPAMANRAETPDRWSTAGRHAAPG